LTEYNRNISMYQEEYKVITVTITTSAGAVKDLTSATATWNVRQKLNDTANLISKTVGSGITLTDADGGVLTITIDTADTSAMSGKYFHELRVVDSDSHEEVVLVGTLTVNPSMTT
jgi:hypothetical protein